MLCKIFSKMTHFIAWNNKIDVPLESSIHSTFKVAKLSSFDGGDVESSIHSTFKVAKLSSFDVGDDFSDSRMNPEEGDDDKNHGVQSTFNVDKNIIFLFHFILQFLS